MFTTHRSLMTEDVPLPLLLKRIDEMRAGVAIDMEAEDRASDRRLIAALFVMLASALVATLL